MSAIDLSTLQPSRLNVTAPAPTPVPAGLQQAAAQAAAPAVRTPILVLMNYGHQEPLPQAIASDPKRAGYFTAGMVMANFSIYVGVAKGLKPQGDLKGLTDALAKRQFEGTLNPDGSLSYFGATYRWDAG